MSVIFETSHSVMGPYAAIAAAGLALNAWTTAFSSALLVKTLLSRRRRLVDGDGKGGGEGGSESDGDAAVRSTGSHCSGQATPFSVSPRLTGKHHLIRFSGCDLREQERRKGSFCNWVLVSAETDDGKRNISGKERVVDWRRGVQLGTLRRIYGGRSEIASGRREELAVRHTCGS